MKLKKLTHLVCLSFCLFSTVAFAGGGGVGGSIVFDPTNYGQTTITAAKAVQAETQRATAYITQLRQYESELIQMLPFNPAQIRSQLQQTRYALNQFRAYQNQLVALNGSVGAVQQRLNMRYDEARILNVPFTTYMQNEAQNLQQHKADRVAIAQQDMNVIQNLQTDYAQTQAMQDQINSTQGTHQAVGLMNQQMNQLVSTMVTVKGQLALASLQRQKDMADSDAEKSDASQVKQKIQNDTNINRASESGFFSVQ